MPKQTEVKRLIVCIDGARSWSDRTSAGVNTTNISKIRTLALDGERFDPIGRLVNQIVVYHQAIEAESTPLLKLKGRDKTEDQIEAITKEICQTLDSPQDELFLYGSGRGAYIVRAVAGVLHHMGLAKSWAMVRFHEIYHAALDLYKARCDDDATKGLKLMQSLKVQCMDPPQIKFIGIFDTIKDRAEVTTHDLSFNQSTTAMRHAVALNENQFDHVGVTISGEQAGRSLVQAWFMGTTSDLSGGTQHDGLSLYPLQWMLIESMKAGLVVRAPTNSEENPLKLTFPQFASSIPRIGDNEQAEWQSNYTNGLQVSMYDLHPTHAKMQTKYTCTHNVKLKEGMSLYENTRKAFNSDGLIGWSEKALSGSIIHPSVYCLLDRYPRLQENSRYRAISRELADFRERCMESNDKLPPWLEGMQLQESGVTAFRILVCGKTGVGKSTLINKVFGVEITEESQSYAQGVHDINQAFESPSHPGLLVHDSRGWQAGSDQELELIAKFLRHRAFQKEPAEALHVIWFCVDSDVSRIEEADRKTFATIAQFSHQVPVFVVGTKKDKIVACQKMRLLEKYMEKTENFKEANVMANKEANRLAEVQFQELLGQLSQIKHYKADGYCCISKEDDIGIRELLSQTLGLIADDRVRLFCVAAQVVSVEQKISSAITESMRLGTHAIRTAVIPLPFSGMIGTPTVSRLLCEQILQCFGFPKAAPGVVEDIMSRVVMGNLKAYMTVAVTQFLVVGGASIGLAVATLGIGSLLGLTGSIFSAAPTARMLLKCACDMILILERSFRYGGKYVSAKQIEDAARYYTTTTVRTFGGNEKLLQKHVHDEVERLIPLTNMTIAIKFGKLRVGLEEIIYNNRFEKPTTPTRAELGIGETRAELSNSGQLVELDDTSVPAKRNEKKMELVDTVVSPVLVSPDSAKTEAGSYSWTSSSISSEQVLSKSETMNTVSRSTDESDSQRKTLSRGQTEALPNRWKSLSKFTRKKSKTID